MRYRRILRKDELAGKTEIINTDELKKQFEQSLNDYYSENYEQLIGTFDEGKNKLSWLFFNYNKLLDQLFEDYNENIFFLESDCIFHDELTIIKKTGKHITVNYNSPHEEIHKYKGEIRKALIFDFRSKKEKADKVFLK
jgi:hypothetical protein